MPDVEGHPIVAKLGRLAGSPTLPPPPPQKPNTCTQASLQRCSQAKGPTKKKAKKARGRNLRLDRRSSSGGTDGPPEAASGSHGPPEAASGSRNRPTSYPTYVYLLFIYIYIYVCKCVFSGRGTTTLVDTLSSKSSAHVVASGTQQGAAVQKIAAEFCDFEFGGCTSSRTTERRSAGFGGSHPLSSPGLGAPTPYSQARRAGGLPLPTSPSWGLPMGSHPLKTPGAFTPLNSPGLGAPTP